METLRAHGFDEILAVCGGCCACATCHVYVEADGAAPLEPRSDDEDALLEGSDHLKPQSRLSCQIPLTAERDGLRVTIAPED
jgi:2Fe-2S ferredoxin